MIRPLRLPLAVLSLAACLAAHPATAAQGATDTAVPHWQSGSTYSTTRGVDCSDSANNPYYPSGCKFSLNTVATGANCFSELITVSSGIGSNFYRNTGCSATVTGSVSATPAPSGCQLLALQSLKVTFNSGVLPIFNGTFTASAQFTPITANTTYTVHVTGGSTTDQGSTATAGTVDDTFTITFSPRLSNNCADPDHPPSQNAKGGLVDLTKTVQPDSSTSVIVMTG